MNADGRVPHRHSHLWHKFFARHDEIRYVEFQWIDYSGILRARSVPVERCDKFAAQGAPLRAGCFSMIGLALDGMEHLPKQYMVGSRDGLYPDWTSLRMLDVKRASVLCFVSEEPLEQEDKLSGPSFARCPRTMITKLINDICTADSTTFKVGFELEFYLIREDERPEQKTRTAPGRVNTSSFWSTAVGIRGHEGACVEACVDALQDAGVVVEQHHAEYGQHQYEVSLAPLSPLTAIDTLIQAQQIVRIVSWGHGFRATFFPYPIQDMMTSALHIHLSMHDESGLPMIGTKADSFLAGILNRLPVLVALTKPIAESYRQINLPDLISDWVAWGTDNRNAPVRRIDRNHWEYRIMDPTANVYLALGGCIASGMLGVRAAELLTWKDCRRSIHSLSEEARLDLGIVQRLPNSIEKALDLLVADASGNEGLLGAELLEYYSWVKYQEIKWLRNVEEADRAALFLSYF